MIKMKFGKEFYTVILGFLISLRFLFYFVCPAQGVPSISSVRGTIIEGKSVTISGSGFSTHAVNIEWLGGGEGNIEQGTTGEPLSKERWMVDVNSGGFTSPVYDNTYSHSYSKSIKCNISDGKWASGFKYNHSSPIASVYVSWWVRFSPAEGEGGQWKMWRLRPDGSVNDRDGEIMSSHWYEQNHEHSMFYVMLFCKLNSYDQCYPDANAGLRWLDSSKGTDIGSWNRIEYYAEESSSSGVRDGTFIYNIHKQNKEVDKIVNWEGNIMTRAADVLDRWQYVCFQNYWGNNNADNADIWIDDIYIQVGSRARVEIGNNSIWDNCSYREIQIPSAWSDNSITININQGSFKEGETVYLFVVDENGIAGVGYPLLFGLGDLNNDGEVNIQDIQLCVNVILGVESNPEIVAGADMNEDGEVNNLDIEEIINIILTQ